MNSTLSGHLPRQPSRPGGWDLAAAVRPAPPRTVPDRRVRHLVRDGVAVVAFSAAASTAVALALLLLVRWAG